MNKLTIYQELQNVRSFIRVAEYEDALNVLEDTMNELSVDPDIVSQGGVSAK